MGFKDPMNSDNGFAQMPHFLIKLPDPGICLHFQLNQVFVAGIHRSQLVIVGHCFRLVNVIGVRHWAEAISDFGRASSSKRVYISHAIKDKLWVAILAHLSAPMHRPRIQIHVFTECHLPIFFRWHFYQGLYCFREERCHRVESNSGHFRSSNDQNFAQNEGIVFLEKHDQSGEGGGELFGGIMGRIDVIQIEYKLKKMAIMNGWRIRPTPLPSSAQRVGPSGVPEGGTVQCPSQWQPKRTLWMTEFPSVPSITV